MPQSIQVRPQGNRGRSGHTPQSHVRANPFPYLSERGNALSGPQTPGEYAGAGEIGASDAPTGLGTPAPYGGQRADRLRPPGPEAGRVADTLPPAHCSEALTAS